MAGMIAQLWPLGGDVGADGSVETLVFPLLDQGIEEVPTLTSDAHAFLDSILEGR